MTITQSNVSSLTSLSFQETLSDLLLEIGDSGRIVLQNQGVGTNNGERIKVLREEPVGVAEITNG